MWDSMIYSWLSAAVKKGFLLFFCNRLAKAHGNMSDPKPRPDSVVSCFVFVCRRVVENRFMSTKRYIFSMKRPKKMPLPQKTAKKTREQNLLYFFLVMTACVNRISAFLASDGGSRRMASIAR